MKEHTIAAHVFNGKRYCLFSDVEALISKVREEARSVSVDGWQGKDNLKIVKEGDEWFITEHRKDKHSKIVAQKTSPIPHSQVVTVWNIIKARCELVGEKTKYRLVASDLILHHNLSVGIDEFNGGLNRSTVYFPLYYYPMKVLEHLGNVKFGGRGNIVRLQK